MLFTLSLTHIDYLLLIVVLMLTFDKFKPYY